MLYRPLRHRYLLGLAACLLLSSPALLQAQKSPAAGAAPRLDIRLLVTAEPEKVFRSTRGPDGQYYPPQPVKMVQKGQLVVAVVYFRDCKPNAAGNCNVDLDFWGVRPGGATFQNRKGVWIWRNKPAPHPGFSQLGSSYMKIQFEPSDPSGTYLLVAVAHDRNSGIDSRAEASFELK